MLESRLGLLLYPVAPLDLSLRWKDGDTGIFDTGILLGFASIFNVWAFVEVLEFMLILLLVTELLGGMIFTWDIVPLVTSDSTTVAMFGLLLFFTPQRSDLDLTLGLGLHGNKELLVELLDNVFVPLLDLDRFTAMWLLEAPRLK